MDYTAMTKDAVQLMLLCMSAKVLQKNPDYNDLIIYSIEIGDGFSFILHLNNKKIRIYKKEPNKTITWQHVWKGKYKNMTTEDFMQKFNHFIKEVKNEQTTT